MRALLLVLLAFVPLPACAQDGASGADVETATETTASESGQTPEPPATAPPPERGGSTPAGASAPRPSLDLNRLLRPPSPRPAPAADTPPGGRDRESWETEFAERRREVAELEATVESTKAQLRESASSDWGYSPTAGSLPTDPEVLRLRARLKRDRQSLETAQRRLRELQVEASLAGVPEQWKAPQR